MIINADDFGLSESATNAITEAFKKGLISDTTMLANGEAFDAAVKSATENGFDKNVGIHFNLTAGKPLTDGIKNFPAFCENGIFHHRINRLKPLSKAEKQAVYDELSEQASKMRNAGFAIDHADSHHHIHTAIFISPIVLKVCDDFGIQKIRIHRNIGKIPAYKRAVKNIYNKNLIKRGFKTTDCFGSLEDIKDITPPDSVEIMVHPDYDKDGVLIDRRDYINGIPSGVPLYSVAEKYNLTLKSYGDL